MEPIIPGICMHKQRRAPGMRPCTQAHPVDPYQHGTGGSMYGPQQHGEGVPLYGQPAMHVYGGTQWGLRYGPQGYI